MPCEASHSKILTIKGTPATGTLGLAFESVKGRSRLPKPAVSINADGTVCVKSLHPYLSQ